MKSSLWVVSLVSILAGTAEARRVQPGPGDHVLRGPVKVLEARPHNPAGKDRLFTRIHARVETDGKGQPVIVLVHAASGQSCRFPAWKSSRGRYLIDGAPPCTFQALGSRGTVQVVEGSLWEAGGQMTLQAVLRLKWLHYRGTVQVEARGGPALVRAR